ncbi:anti-sigma factor domain-containing protein [Methylobacterium sp. J-076]|uniref:anti-sigma factor n=1 Tax=Methylobacterium sp. J-076 TaxID=2836655 RepID=UPI001FB96079|nr:anti-sigma factor [Methylobacterium sp. J-076]MCJ2014047.1 anti-sigma factor [Methylobacterium sp. J-076]
MSTPQPWADDPDGAAGEYVLGTLPEDERAAFAHALEREAGLRAAVSAWEARLSPLAGAIPAATPDPGNWAAIAARIGRRPDAAGGARIVRLERGLRRWRLAAGMAGALAAGLALWIAAGPRPAAEGTQYLAVVDRGGALPALIVRVDLGSGMVQVRSLAAEAPPDRSLELWYVGAGAAPRSLGLVTDAGARLPVPPALRAGAEGASLAVSVEPKGGSPTGAPTGPVIYSGKLVRDGGRAR